jgi:CRP-like cAMP-binding protein
MLSIFDSVLAPALRKLEKWTSFSAEDRAAFQAVPFSTKSMSAGSYVVREHDPVQSCYILLSGLAFRSKIVGNGGRQILSMHVPGDFLNLQHAMLSTADHNINMLTTGDVALVPAAALKEIAFQHPAIGHAMWLDTLVDGAILREWIANIGRRDARTRVAHLLCEFAVRLHPVGLTAGDSFELPMTQEQLGDATGLTSVHVNRTLQGLRADGLIRTEKRAVTIENWKALTIAGDFDAAYLHPEVEGGSLPEQAISRGTHSSAWFPASIAGQPDPRITT